MKRKAMLVGMAVMAGMPGWATAKGAGKTAGGAHAYADGPDARERFGTVEAIPGVPGADVPRGKASELLAQIKAMLGSVNYGTVVKPAPDGTGWTVELMQKTGEGRNYGDALPGSAAPLGVAFRLRF